MSGRPGRRGFTLLELTVGLLLTSLALALGYGTYGMAIDRQAAVEVTLDADLRATAIRALLTEWVQGVQRESQPGTPLLTGLDGSRDGTAADEITVLTSPEGGAVGRVPLRIFLERDPETPEQGLMAEWRTPTGRLERRVLAGEVAGLQIRYLSGVLGERQWLPSWVSTSVLPAGVEIRLLAAPGATLHPLLELPLRIPLEAGR